MPTAGIISTPAVGLIARLGDDESLLPRELRLPGQDHGDVRRGGGEVVRDGRLGPERVLDDAVVLQQLDLHADRADHVDGHREVLELLAEVDIRTAELLVERGDGTDLGSRVEEALLAALQVADGLREDVLTENRSFDLDVSTEVGLGTREHRLAVRRQLGDVLLTHTRHRPVRVRRGAVLSTHDDPPKSYGRITEQACSASIIILFID